MLFRWSCLYPPSYLNTCIRSSIEMTGSGPSLISNFKPSFDQRDIGSLLFPRFPA